MFIRFDRIHEGDIHSFIQFSSRLVAHDRCIDKFSTTT